LAHKLVLLSPRQFLSFRTKKQRNRSGKKRLFSWADAEEETDVPVILLWGIPTLIVLGGGTYWLLHMHH
jgi:hypothetical protein